MYWKFVQPTELQGPVTRNGRGMIIRKTWRMDIETLKPRTIAVSRVNDPSNKLSHNM